MWICKHDAVIAADALLVAARMDAVLIASDFVLGTLVLTPCSLRA